MAEIEYLARCHCGALTIAIRSVGSTWDRRDEERRAEADPYGIPDVQSPRDQLVRRVHAQFEQRRYGIGWKQSGRQMPLDRVGSSRQVGPLFMPRLIDLV
jgi:hypothetical protein